MTRTNTDRIIAHDAALAAAADNLAARLKEASETAGRMVAIDLDRLRAIEMLRDRLWTLAKAIDPATDAAGHWYEDAILAAQGMREKRDELKHALERGDDIDQLEQLIQAL